MPRYQVTAPGFHGGVLYSPTGKHRILAVNKPFKGGKDGNMPSWVNPKPISEETAAQRKKRLAAEKKNADKVESDQKDIKDESFMGDGEKADSPAVETI